MKDTNVLRRYAAWGLALGVTLACSAPNNTAQSVYGYGPIDASSLGQTTSSSQSSQGSSAMSSSSGASSGGTSSSDGGGNASSGKASEAGSCPGSCKANADCASCGLPPGSSVQNCCVMAICVAMTICPTIRDAGRNGS